MNVSRFLLVATLGFSSSLQAQLYWDNVGGTVNDWGSLANWSTVVGGGTDPAALPTTTDTVVFSASSVAALQTVNLNAGRSVLGLSFTSSLAHSLLGGGTNQSLTLAAGGIAKTGTGAVTIGSATAGQQVAIALSADQTWANNNATGIITINNGVAASTAVNRLLTLGGTNILGDTIAGVIANNGAGVMSLAKSDAGLWVLTNTANTYTGGTVVNGGELQAFYNGTTAGTYANLGTGAVTVNAGATLRFRTASTANAIQWNNAINLNNATLIHDDGTQTLAGAVALTGANTISGRWSGKNLTLSGIVSGGGSFTKTNTAAQDTVLILSGVNTYTGSTTVSDGILRLASAAALGGSTAILVQNNENPAAANTNTLQLSGGFAFGTGKTLTLRNNSISNISNARTALENLSGNNSWAGAIVLDQGLNQTLTSTAGTLTVSGNISQSATPSTSLFVRGASSGVLSGGVNLGTAQLFKTDSGSWTVNTTGNVHGTVTVANGTLTANNNNALDPTASLVLGEGSGNQGVFSINATFAQEFAGISTAATTTGAQTISGAGALSTGAAAKTFTVNDAAAVADDLTISATISGAGGFTKTGAGTLFLNGNTVAGPVSVGAGTLRGAFTANGGLSVQAGGTLTPGSSITAGTITASTLAFGAGASSVAINVGNGPSDQISVVNAGGLTIAGTATFTVSPSGGFTVGNNYNLISYTGATPGTAGFALATLPGRVVGNLTDTGTAIALAVTANDKVKWTGATSAVWDINTTPNWQTVTGGAPTNYLQGDDLVFPDGAANTAITLGVAVNPANAEFTNTPATSYTISGAGSLGGAMILSKTGTGTVTLSGSAAHGYNGATTISAGTFVVNQGTGGLTATSGVALSSGATLRLYADNANITFSRNLTGAGTVIIDPNASGTAGARDVTFTGTNTGFSGTILLQPSGTVAANGTMRLVGTTTQANLGSAAINVKPGGQLWWTGIINNNVTISGTGYAEAAGGTPVAGTGLTYGGIGAMRMGTELSGALTLDGTAKIENYGGTTTLSGAIGVNNASYLLVVGGGGSGSTTILTGTNNAAGAASLNQIWVNSGGSGGGIDLLQVGNNGTTGTLGLGTVFLQGDAAKTAQIRFSRSDGYTLAQNIQASANTATADLARTQVVVNTTGTGLTLNGKTLDLSDGTNGGILYVAGVGGASGVTGSLLNIDAGSVVDLGNMYVGEQANFSGLVNQTGGSVSIINQFRLGHYATETSTYTMSGGTLTFTGTPASTPSAGGEVNGGLYVGIDGTGVFNQSGGTVSTRFVVLDNRVDTGAGANMPTGIDQYNLSGTGALELNNAWGVIARNLTSEFNWNGGTIRNTGTSIAVGLNTPIIVGASGGTLDTVSAGNSFVLMNNLTGAGIVTSAGGGTLTLNPDSNTTRTGTSTGTGTQTISAILAGTSPLTKIGSGTSTLTGVNTYNGATTVTAGRLNVTGSANNSAFTVAATLGGEGSIGNLSLSAGSFLALDPTTTAALSAVALTTAPTTTVQFDAQPSSAGLITVLNYTGARTGAIGDFALANAANYRSAVFNDTGTKITLDTGAKALVWNGNSGGQWNVNTSSRWNAAEADKFFWGDQVTFDDTGVTAAVTLTGELRPGSFIVNSSAAGQNYTLTASAGNIIAGSTSLLKAGTSVLTLAGNVANTFTGGTTIRQGEIRVQNGGALGTGTITLGDASTGAGNTALYIDTNRTTVSVPVVVSNNGSGTATLGTRSSIGATGSFGFSNITLQRDVVFDSNAADRTDYTNIGGTGNITVTGGARTLLNSVNPFTGNITISLAGVGGYLQTGVATAGNQNYIPDASNLTVNDFAGATQAEYRLSTGGETIAGLFGNGTVDVNSIAGTLTVGFGDVSSTFSGQMVNGGASVLSLTKIGVGTLTLTGNNTATGATSVNGGLLQIGTGGTSGAIGGPLAIAAGTTVNVDRSDASVLPGALSGTGTLNKAGAGTFSLNAGGSFSGTINLNGGALVANITNPWGSNATTATIVMADGTTLSTTTSSTHAHFGNLFMSGGSTVTTGSGTGSYNGENFQLNGTVTVAGGTSAAIITREATRTDANSGISLRGDRTFNVADVTGTSAADLIVSTELEASDNDAGVNQSALTKTGTGTMLLSSLNTYTGNTTINAGVLELGAGAKMYNAAFNNTAVVTVNAGGTWRVRDYSYGGVGQLADYAQRRVLNGGTIEVTGNTHTSGQDFTVNAAGGTFRYTPAGQTLTLGGNVNTDTTINGPLTFDTTGNIAVTGTSSILQGTGSVTKTGAGTLTLSQANTYAGTTTVQQGTLMLTGSVPGLINVSSGATLGGGGSGGDTTLAGSAILSPGELDGNADNFLSAASLTLADDTVLHFELGVPQNTYYTDPVVGSYFTDHVAVAGALVLDGKIRIANRPDATSHDLSTVVFGDRWLILSYSTTAGLTDNTLEIHPDSIAAPAGLTFRINTTSNPGYVYVEAVPEAGTAGLFALGMLLLRRLRRS